MPLEPGKSFGHYRIVRLIGQGGMGAVYLAEDEQLERNVAIKALPPVMASDAAMLERFRREAKVVAALNHPQIVTIHSVEEGVQFLTMELVEGEGLDRTLPPGGLPLARVFDIGIALADALAAAHEKGIIHRDLKPANVMLTKDGRVKVLDFGLAKLAPHTRGIGRAARGAAVSEALTAISPPDQPLTDAGLVVGTVPYMSPEQLKGQSVDARTDIFSLGVVLYEMATGRRPFEGSALAETISSILRDAPRPVTEARRDAPRHLGRIIDHCLKKEPQDRYQTARDVYNELKDLRKEVESGDSAVVTSRFPVDQGPAGEPPASGPASGTSTVSTPSGAAKGTADGRPWIWAAGGAAAVVAVALVFISAFWLGRRDGEPDPAGAPSGDAAAHAPGGTTATVIETNSVAVLPFTNMRPDKDQEYFSDGLTEELLNALSKIPDLKVAGRTSSFSFKGKNENLRPQVGRQDPHLRAAGESRRRLPSLVGVVRPGAGRRLQGAGGHRRLGGAVAAGHAARRGTSGEDSRRRSLRPRAAGALRHAVHDRGGHPPWAGDAGAGAQDVAGPFPGVGGDGTHPPA